MATASEEPSIFIGLSLGAAREAVRLGIPVAAFGKLHDLDPTAFDLSQPNRKGLRRKLSQSVRAGVSIEEEPREPTDPELQVVSDHWLSGRKGKELGLIVTPFPGGLEPDVRLFVARQGAAIVGFASFDPCYASGRVIGYSLGHLRFLNHPPGTTVHLLLAALQAFGSQGIPRMSLGLAPLSGVSQSTHQDELPTSTWGRLFFRWWYDHGTFLYSFRGIERFKDSFRARTSAVYVAASRGGSPLDLAVAAHALRLQAF